MPEWGLTKRMRRTKPFGLSDEWLEPSKVITDPIHGDIFVTRLEQLLLDTPPMQRLRRIRQLGTTHLLYPGATHTRFSHSLGALRVVQTLLDVAIHQRDSPHPVPDLFNEWLAEDERSQAADDDSVTVDFASGGSNEGETFYQRIAEASVLARLGALLHDLGHLPFGHAVEDDLGLLTPHDENEERFDRIWEEVLGSMRGSIDEQGKRQDSTRAEIHKRLEGLAPLNPGEGLHDLIKKLVLSNRKNGRGERIDPASEIKRYPFVADMVGNTICADLLDYLQRDHRFTGLPISLGQRYLSSFYITPDRGGGLYKARMALQIYRNGRLRQDVITEILKHLRYRYELQERVLVHHLKLTADAMVGKLIELWQAGELERLRSLSTHELAARLAEVPDDFPLTGERDAPSKRDLPRGKRPELVARWQMEHLFLSHGDDGLLEHLSTKRFDTCEGSPTRAAGELANDLLNRHLYRHAANAADAHAAEDLHRKFGSAERRRELERVAAEHAELEHDWHLILWVPGPSMRLKLAELLVDYGKGIAKFKDYSDDGSEIYNAHKALWSIGVFTHPDVSDNQSRKALAKLAQEMGICWDAHERLLGKDPESWPYQLAAIEVLNVEDRADEVGELVRIARSGELAARGGPPRTHKALVSELKEVARQRGLLKRRRSSSR